MPNLVTCLYLTSIFELYCMWFGVASENGYQKDMFERDWTACSKYNNLSKLNSQHNWGKTYMTV